jgi:TolB-like protein
VAIVAGCSGVHEVKMQLPLKPRIPLKGNERVAIAPFLIVASADKPKDKADLANVDLQAEFHRYLVQHLQKKTKLQVIDLGTTIQLPSRELVALSRAGDFWRNVGQKNGADIIVSGSLEFKIEDSAGYKTEEYVSPVTGQTSFRQIYVERTGFLFDIVFLVFDGKTGDRLLQDEFKDFRERNRRRTDEMLGLFQNLFALEDQILNMFVPRQRAVQRYIFSR